MPDAWSATRPPITCGSICHCKPYAWRWGSDDRLRACCITPIRAAQYTSQLYQDELARHGMQASMSRRGECWDNAAAESFFSILKCEIGVPRRYACIADACRVLFEYIEVFYNRQRLHSSNGYRSPAVAEAEAA